MYSTITAKVVDQTLTILDAPKLASGGENEIRVEVNFDSTWASFGMTAIFYRKENQVYHVVMTNGVCVIPREVMTEPGRLYFGIMGASGSSVRTTEVVALNVVQGAITVGVAEPLPDVYRQVLSAYGGLSTDLEAERKRIDNLATLTEGSTTGDAELIDIRVGYDGTTYTNAGTSVREQVGALASRVADKLTAYILSTNRLNPDATTIGYALGTGDGVPYAIDGFCISDYCDVASKNPTGFLRVGGIGSGSGQPRICFYDANKKWVSTITGGSVQNAAISIPSGAVYARVQSPGDSLANVYVNVGDITGFTPYTRTVYDGPLTKMSEMDNDIGLVGGQWYGKTVLFYGDSITAQGNADPKDFYGHYAAQRLGFTPVVRGVGGQTYKANTATFYAAADGSYSGRYGQNGLTEAPDGTTTHLGYFCSWDRITTMIPESIREDIAAVVLCGGTNDHNSVEDVETDGVIAARAPSWVAGDATDVEWVSSSLYMGGDYDISTFAGGIASAIMKMRVWCPNAVVILATPYPRYNTSTMTQYTNSNGLDFREMCEIQVATAKYMGAPVIDANATSGISAVDFASTVTDGVHPNTTGKKLYGKAIADGMCYVGAKIE